MTVSSLLDFIARFESRGDYNIVWGGIRAHDRPPRPLTSLTVGQVLDWQDSIDRKYMSEAAGRYQIMEDTLRGMYRGAGVPLSAVFDKSTQDALATHLLKRRGLDDYLAGRMSLEAFALSLSKEWASLPVPYDIKRGDRTIKRGQSYYAGDGLNAAHADVDEFLSAIQSVRGTPDREPREKLSQSTTARGGAIAATGAAGQAGVKPLADEVTAAAGEVQGILQYAPELQWLFVGLTVMGAALALWSRRKDFYERGRR